MDLAVVIPDKSADSTQPQYAAGGVAAGDPALISSDQPACPLPRYVAVGVASVDVAGVVSSKAAGDVPIDAGN